MLVVLTQPMQRLDAPLRGSLHRRRLQFSDMARGEQPSDVAAIRLVAACERSAMLRRQDAHGMPPSSASAVPKNTPSRKPRRRSSTAARCRTDAERRTGDRARQGGLRHAPPRAQGCAWRCSACSAVCRGLQPAVVGALDRDFSRLMADGAAGFTAARITPAACGRGSTLFFQGRPDRSESAVELGWMESCPTGAGAERLRSSRSWRIHNGSARPSSNRRKNFPSSINRPSLLRMGKLVR